jgi:hypothetical protein
MKRHRAIAKSLQQNQESQTEVDPPAQLDDNDDQQPWHVEDLSLLRDDITTCDSTQRASNHDSYDSNSEGTFSPGDEYQDEREDDDSFDLQQRDPEEARVAFLENNGARDDDAVPDPPAHNGSSTQEYEDMDEPPPVHEASIEWSSLEVASLQLLALCDNSGARRGFYDELLALLRHFRNKSIDLSKARGRESLLSRIGVKVSVPKAKVSVVDGRPVVYFPFKDSLHDLLLSTTFDYVDNLCVNKSDQDHFKPFEPVENKDYGEIMAKDWSRESREDIEGFDPENDFFLPIMMYGDKTGTDVNQR